MINFNPSALVDSPGGSTAVIAQRTAGPSIIPADGQKFIRARFDNQFTTDQNQNIWALADNSSVDAAANPGVRRILRMRGRYAYHNNPYFMSAANRLSCFVIGSGPKLHLNMDREIASPVEKAFAKWGVAVALPRKFRVSRAARFYNGEGFNLLRTNPRVKHAVNLDLFEVEADQVSSPYYGVYPGRYPDQDFDGLTLDPWGNREMYHVLRQHPGAAGTFVNMGTESDPWPAQYVLHDYAHLRPAQQRGIPEATPALDLFEELRAYRKSVQAAARTASDHAGIIKTASPAEEPTYDPDTGFGTNTDYINTKRGQLAVLPVGWEMQQLKAEQPATTFDAFTMTLLTEISQVTNMPLFILTGDARLANMSSAYVATQSFVKSVITDRQEYGLLLDQVLEEWLLEARRVPGLIPKDFPDDPERTWRWDRVAAHADPDKMASATAQRLKNGSSPSKEFALEGDDWEEEVSRAADDYGVSEDEYKAAFFQATFASRGTPPPAATVPGTGDTPPNDTSDDSADRED